MGNFMKREKEVIAMLWYCRFKWHPTTTRQQMAQRVVERHEAGANRPDVLVLALPRGGVPVAFEVARALHAPLDVIIVRKLGVSGEEELAMGAIASGGVFSMTTLCCKSIAAKCYDRHRRSEEHHEETI
jgi:putative phosphoribosyl transferase